MAFSSRNLVLLLVTIPFAQISGQTRTDGGSKARPVEFSADRTEMVRRGDGFIKKYFGSVEVRFTDRERATADEAVYDGEGQYASLAGSVVMQDSGRVLKADRVQYLFRGHPRAGGHPLILLHGNVTLTDEARRMNARRAEYRPQADSMAVFGGVVARENSRVILADTVFLWGGADQFLAAGNVVLHDTSENVTIRAGVYRHDGRDSTGTAAREPMFVRGDGDTAITVRADTFRLDPKGKNGSAWGGVRITRGKVSAVCDSLTLDDSAGEIALYGDPHAVQSEESDSTVTRNSLWGRRIVLDMERSRVKRILVEGSARATNVRGDSLAAGRGEQWMAGSNMVFDIEEDEVRLATVWGGARSRYEPDDPERGQDGSNEAAGDTIRVAFNRGKASRVTIRGGVQGMFLQNKRTAVAPMSELEPRGGESAR